jgi:hypothetical protein
MKEKVELAAQMMENKLLPTDYIYENIFHLSEDQYDEYRELIREDAKRNFRITQIENEGNDPSVTGQSYGTPHDLASLYGKERMHGEPGNVPDGYDEKKTLGRPKEKASNIDKQDSAFGKDRLGKSGMKKDSESSNPLKHKYNGNSPLALETKHLSKSQEDMLNKMPTNKKQMIFEKDEEKLSLLDDKQIRR